MTGQDIGDEAAFARPYSMNEEGWHREAQTGLTKREWLAGLAMQGLLASLQEDGFSLEAVAENAVGTADALLAELAKEAS